MYLCFKKKISFHKAGWKIRISVLTDTPPPLTVCRQTSAWIAAFTSGRVRLYNTRTAGRSSHFVSLCIQLSEQSDRYKTAILKPCIVPDTLQHTHVVTLCDSTSLIPRSNPPHIHLLCSVPWYKQPTSFNTGCTLTLQRNLASKARNSPTNHRSLSA